MQARRKARRLERQLSKERADWARRREELVERYEHHLALERGRFNRMQAEMVGKICQLAKLDPPALADIEEDILDPRWRKSDEEPTLLDTMGQETYRAYVDRRESFWEEGEEMGCSPAEIRQRWNAVKPLVIKEMTEGEIIEEI